MKASTSKSCHISRLIWRHSLALVRIHQLFSSTLAFRSSTRWSADCPRGPESSSASCQPDYRPIANSATRSNFSASTYSKAGLSAISWTTSGAGKNDLDPDGWGTVRSSKSLARDSAFRLLYMFLLDGLVSVVQDKAMAYNAAFFVVSHPRIFRNRARKMIRWAFDERFGITYKQQKNMDKWPLKNSTGGGSSEDDQTTASEGYGYGYDYDSDHYM